MTINEIFEFVEKNANSNVILSSKSFLELKSQSTFVWIHDVVCGTLTMKFPDKKWLVAQYSYLGTEKRYKVLSTYNGYLYSKTAKEILL